MRAVVQRVRSGSVTVGEEEVSRIGHGLVVLLGVAKGDGEEDARYLADKIVHLRIFEDDSGKMNLSLKDITGEIMAVSQFTLYGDCRQGRRPSFIEAAPPQEAQKLYELFIDTLSRHNIVVKRGVFQEHMLVRIANDGPVTIMLDSSKTF